MEEIIGGLDRRTLVGKFELKNSDPLDVIAEAIWLVTRENPDQFKKDHSPKKGIKQVLYKGPVIEWEQNNGSCPVRVYRNGGKEKNSTIICDYIESYSV